MNDHNKSENPQKDISKLADLLEILGGENLDQGSAPRYYFRGESIYERPLIPKLVRNSTLLGENGMPGLIKNNPTIDAIQTRLLQRLKRYAVHIYLQNNRPWQGDHPSDWEWLSVAQHHGLPTLLSDWTINPLVALYFSVWKYHGEEDGVFYRMKLKERSFRDKKNLTVRVGQTKNKIIKKVDSHTYEDNETYEEKEIYEDKEIILSKANKALIVVPLVFTRRIEAQSARFIYAGYTIDGKELEEEKIKASEPLEYYADQALNALPAENNENLPWEEIKKFKVPKSSKGALLRQLRNAQIHHGTLFPDLDGYADYLRMGGD